MISNDLYNRLTKIISVLSKQKRYKDVFLYHIEEVEMPASSVDKKYVFHIDLPETYEDVVIKVKGASEYILYTYSIQVHKFVKVMSTANLSEVETWLYTYISSLYLEINKSMEKVNTIVESGINQLKRINFLFYIEYQSILEDNVLWVKIKVSGHMLDFYVKYVYNKDRKMRKDTYLYGDKEIGIKDEKEMEIGFIDKELSNVPFANTFVVTDYGGLREIIYDYIDNWRNKKM